MSETTPPKYYRTSSPWQEPHREVSQQSPQMPYGTYRQPTQAQTPHQAQPYGTYRQPAQAQTPHQAQSYGTYRQPAHAQHQQPRMSGSVHTPAGARPLRGSQKNAVIAAFLAFFFGPLGMFYATIPGAIIMLIIGIVNIVLICTISTMFFVVFLFANFVGVAWSILAVMSHNKRVMQA